MYDNTIPGNPHAEETLSQYHYIGEEWISDEGMTDATMIAGAIHTQALATLSLAFEQRTANLIALSVARGPSGHPAVLNDLWEHLMEDIATRLGLDGVQS